MCPEAELQQTRVQINATRMTADPNLVRHAQQQQQTSLMDVSEFECVTCDWSSRERHRRPSAAERQSHYPRSVPPGVLLGVGTGIAIRSGDPLIVGATVLRCVSMPPRSNAGWFTHSHFTHLGASEGTKLTNNEATVAANASSVTYILRCLKWAE